MMNRRFLLAGLAALGAGTALADPPSTSSRPRARPGKGAASTPASARAPADPGALLAAANLSGAAAWAVADAATGTLLEAHQPGLALPPASVLKSVTALYALERLGAGRRLQTRVLATGPVRGGRLEGDLILAGGGDPTLQTDQLGDLAARLAQKGIKSISGRFFYWDAALPRLSRIADDQPVQVGYNPALSGLNLNFNRVHFEWKRAGKDWQLGMDARGERFVPKVAHVGIRLAQREHPIFTYAGGDRREDWTVAQGALGKGGSRWLPVRLPGLYAADVFQTLARAQGLPLPAPERLATLPQASELARVESEGLPEVLRSMLRFSTNITAEGVGLLSSGAGDLAASGAAMGAWTRERFGTNARFVDHSGLGGGSRITPSDMVSMLSRAHRENRGLKPILRHTPMRDDAGKAIEGHPVKVVAKSGTLNFVSALAGHITPPGGREMVFAILTGDTSRRDAIPIDQRESPPGSSAWITRSRRLQGQLISRWASLHA